MRSAPLYPKSFAGLMPSWERDPLELDVPTHLADEAKRAVDAAHGAAGL